MEKELTQEEDDQMMKVLETRNMATMFDFGYNLGWQKALEHIHEESEKFAKGFGYKKPPLQR